MPGGYEWIIIIAVLLLLFGAKKLPEMARSVGQSARVFKGEMKGLKDDDPAKKDAEKTVEQPSSAQPSSAQPSTVQPTSGPPTSAQPSQELSAGTTVNQPSPQAQQVQRGDVT